MRLARHGLAAVISLGLVLSPLAPVLAADPASSAAEQTPDADALPPEATPEEGADATEEPSPAPSPETEESEPSESEPAEPAPEPESTEAEGSESESAVPSEEPVEDEETQGPVTLVLPEGTYTPEQVNAGALAVTVLDADGVDVTSEEEPTVVVIDEETGRPSAELSSLDEAGDLARPVARSFAGVFLMSVTAGGTTSSSAVEIAPDEEDDPYYYIDVDPDLVSPRTLADSGVTLSIADDEGEPVTGTASDLTFVSYDPISGEEADRTASFTRQEGLRFTGDLPAAFSGLVYVEAEIETADGVVPAEGVFTVTAWTLEADPWELTVEELASSGVQFSVHGVDADQDASGISPSYTFSGWDYESDGTKDLTGAFSAVPGAPGRFTGQLPEDFDDIVFVTATFTAGGESFTLREAIFVGDFEEEERSLTVTPETLSAEAFVDRDRGVTISAEGLYAEDEITMTVVSGPGSAAGTTFSGTSDEEGRISFHLYGLDATVLDAYVGEYRVELVAIDDDIEELDPLTGGFTVTAPAPQAAAAKPLVRTGTDLGALGIGLAVLLVGVGSIVVAGRGRGQIG